MNPKLLAYYNRLAKGEALSESDCREMESLEVLQMRDQTPVLEIRTYGKLVTREGSKDKGELGIINGRPANFNTLSHDLGGFKERVMPGAFTRSLASEEDVSDVRALIGHDKMALIGRRSAGTLDIREDKEGLTVDIHTIDTTAGRDAWLNTRAGNYNSMSFGFKPKKIKWLKENGAMVRELHDVTLGEVSLVTTIPAYPNTELAARELREFQNTEGTVPRSLLLLRRKRMDLELRYLSLDNPSSSYGSSQDQALAASYQAASATRSARNGDEESQRTAKLAHEKAAKLHQAAAKSAPAHHEALADEHKAMAKMHGGKC